MMAKKEKNKDIKEQLDRIEKKIDVYYKEFKRESKETKNRATSYALYAIVGLTITLFFSIWLAKEEIAWHFIIFTIIVLILAIKVEKIK